MTDAERLSAAMTEASMLLLDLIGFEHEGRTFPATLDLDKLPLGGLRAAKIAGDYLCVGIGILDEAITGGEPEPQSLDEELARVFGEEPV